MFAKTTFNIWVAEDPTQPGTAFAFHSDLDDSRLFVPEWREEMWSQHKAQTRLIARAIGMQMLSQWDRSKSGLCVIHEDECSCGELIFIERGRFDLGRADGKRPHYEHSGPDTTVLRCRGCGGWLATTCKSAAFEGHSLSSNF